MAAFGMCGSNSVSLNTIVTSKTKLKRLKLGTDKCRTLHIGKKKEDCSVLYAEGTEMKLVNEEEYLGEILTKDANIDANIEKRVKKGIGLISPVIAIIKEVSLGRHYFDIGLLFRNSNIINGILTNSEVWYGVRKKHVEQLEKIDEMYIRKLFSAHSKTPIEALYDTLLEILFAV